MTSSQDYPRAGSCKFFFAWFFLLCLLLLPQVILYMKGLAAHAYLAVLSSLLAWIVSSTWQVAHLLMVGESLYAALRKVLDWNLFLITNALPWLAKNRELQFFHVAIARSGIILAKEARPSFWKGSIYNNVRESKNKSRIMIPFDQITRFFRFHSSNIVGEMPGIEVALKVRIDGTAGSNHLISPVLIIPFLKQNGAFVILMYAFCKRPELVPFDSTSEICLTRLFSTHLVIVKRSRLCGKQF